MRTFFLILIFMFNASIAGAGLLSLCKTAFLGKKPFLEGYDFQNPTAQVLVEGYRTAKDLKWFKRKQAKEFEKGLKELVEFLEHSHSHTSADPLKNLSVPLEELTHKVPEIINFTRQQTSPAKALYFRQVTQAVLAFFAKHLPAVLNNSSQADWQRINLIAKNISDFDTQNPRFSLYKIKRAIEGRYSLKEFILCRL